MKESHADRGHPDLDTLADLDAGVLAGNPAEAGLHAHVAGCASCRDQVTMLRDTGLLLAGLPAPALPEDVAVRIGAALAAETGHRRPAGAAAGVTVLPRRPPPAPASPGRWRALATAAASIVLVLAALAGAGALIARHTGGSQSSKTSASELRGPVDAEPPALTGTGRNYTAATLDSDVRALLGAATAGARKAPQPSVPPQSSGSAPGALPFVDPSLSRLRAPGALRACLGELAGRSGVEPLAVDLARYQGRPAAVIVLPDRHPGQVQVWVVGGGCRAAHPDLVRYQVVRPAG